MDSLDAVDAHCAQAAVPVGLLEVLVIFALGPEIVNSGLAFPESPNTRLDETNEHVE